MKGGNLIEPAVHKSGLAFGLNSTKCSLQSKYLVPSEEDLIKFVKKFRVLKINTSSKQGLLKISKSYDHQRKL